MALRNIDTGAGAGAVLLRTAGRRTSGRDITSEVLVLVCGGSEVRPVPMVGGSGHGGDGGGHDRVGDWAGGQGDVGVALRQAGEDVDVGQLGGEAVVGVVVVVTASLSGRAGAAVGCVVAATVRVAGGRGGLAAGLATAALGTLLGFVGGEGLGKELEWEAG